MAIKFHHLHNVPFVVLCVNIVEFSILTSYYACKCTSKPVHKNRCNYNKNVFLIAIKHVYYICVFAHIDAYDTINYTP